MQYFSLFDEKLEKPKTQKKYWISNYFCSGWMVWRKNDTIPYGNNIIFIQDYFPFGGGRSRRSPLATPLPKVVETKIFTLHFTHFTWETTNSQGQRNSLETFNEMTYLLILPAYYKKVIYKIIFHVPLYSYINLNRIHIKERKIGDHHFWEALYYFRLWQSKHIRCRWWTKGTCSTRNWEKSIAKITKLGQTVPIRNRKMEFKLADMVKHCQPWNTIFKHFISS